MKPDAEALELLRRELSADGRGALAHLLGNALTPLVGELDLPDQDVDLGFLRGAVGRLVELTGALRGPGGGR